MGFMEKSLFSLVVICSVNPAGCHATADYLHMPDQASLFFFCLQLFLQHMQINSFMIYMLSCSTSSGTNNGQFCVVISSFHEMCACAISLHIDVINILLLSHYSYHSLSCETVAQFYEITYDDSMCTHIQVFDSVPSESLLL